MHTKLPHISLQHHYQFITIRIQDSIDEYVQKIQNQNNLDTKIKQYEIDKYLDNSKNGAYFFDEKIEMMRELILKRDGNAYEMECFSIMPNHLHLLFKELGGLDNVMKSLKGESSVVMNKELGRSGKFWVSGYFDKLIRDDKHFSRVYEYIQNNALKAGLVDFAGRFYGKY